MDIQRPDQSRKRRNQRIAWAALGVLVIGVITYIIINLKPAVVVPGHGPLTDSVGVRRVRDYLEHVATEATKRFEAGLTVEEAVSSIDMAPFADMSEQGRIAANVLNVYEELDRSRPRADRLEQFGRIASYELAPRG